MRGRCSRPPRRTRARRRTLLPYRTGDRSSSPWHDRGRGADEGARALRSGAARCRRCRDARGTAFVDDTVRDILYALRTFKRAPLAAVTIVSTVALGLGLVAVAFTVLNALLFRVDRAGRARDVRGRAAAAADGERAAFHARAFDALRRETDVFTDAYGELSEADSRSTAA